MRFITLAGLAESLQHIWPAERINTNFVCCKRLHWPGMLLLTHQKCCTMPCIGATRRGSHVADLPKPHGCSGLSGDPLLEVSRRHSQPPSATSLSPPHPRVKVATSKLGSVFMKPMSISLFSSRSRCGDPGLWLQHKEIISASWLQLCSQTAKKIQHHSATAVENHMTRFYALIWYARVIAMTREECTRHTFLNNKFCCLECSIWSPSGF
jgi:hypothetical protein